MLLGNSKLWPVVLWNCTKLTSTVVVIDTLLLIVIIMFSSSGLISCRWHDSESTGQCQWHKCSGQTEQQAQDSLETRSRWDDSCDGEGIWCYSGTLSTQVKTCPYTGGSQKCWPCYSICHSAWMHLLWQRRSVCFTDGAEENRALGSVERDSPWQSKT